jgi:hypothetical protein
MDRFISWDVSGQVLIAFDNKETGFRILAVTYRYFSSPQSLENLGAHPIYFPVAKGKIFSPWLKWSGRESYHLPPSSIEVESVWSCAYIASYIFMLLCFFKQTQKFTLAFFLVPNSSTDPVKV